MRIVYHTRLCATVQVGCTRIRLGMFFSHALLYASHVPIVVWGCGICDVRFLSAHCVDRKRSGLIGCDQVDQHAHTSGCVSGDIKMLRTCCCAETLLYAVIPFVLCASCGRGHRAIFTRLPSQILSAGNRARSSPLLRGPSRLPVAVAGTKPRKAWKQLLR